MPRRCEVRNLGLMEWGQAFRLQQLLVAQRKAGEICDQFLLVEHPHVVTMGRNGRDENLLASPDILERAGIGFYETDRGGDVTYHGPGQIVGYPILDLRGWKRDVHLYVRALEQTLIDTLADFGIAAGRAHDEKGVGLTGVWVDGAKVAAIGVHIGRWVTSHGFAFNLNPDLSYFQYIVPCGLTKPVTSMEQLGAGAQASEITARIVSHFARHFDFEVHDFQTGEYPHGRRIDAPDGREHSRRNVDAMAEEDRRFRRAG
jgi:lipoate-protein ligase B